MRKLYSALAALTAVVALSVCWAADSGAPTVAAIGSSASPFSLQNQDGKIVNLSDFSGKIVVLEWTNPECPFVQRHYQAHTMTTLAAKYQGQGVQWVAINSTHDVTDADNKKWVTEQALPYSVLNDASGTVGHSYGATNTPEMYIVGKDGKLMYKGAIDNDRDGDMTAGKINYVDQALTEILAGKPVSVPETKAYGCTVHYATN